MAKLYGNVINRFEEGKMYVPQIEVGTDITMYYWSDRHCYYVVGVNNQQDILVKQYHICADHSKKGGMGHQDWMYFKTIKEHNDYLDQYFDDRERDLEREKEIDNCKPENWVVRNGKWKEKLVYTLESIKELCEKNHYKFEGYLDWQFTPTQKEKLLKGKEVAKYRNIDKISFGVKDYYYDWEF